jgi:hypothetical protein
VFLKYEYDTRDGTWKNSDSGRQMWSRQKLIDEGYFHYNAIAAGGRVYKVAETADDIVLRATKPDDWSPTEPDGMPADPDDALVLNVSDATTFSVRHDDGEYMGKYDTPTTRTISEGTDLLM